MKSLSDLNFKLGYHLCDRKWFHDYDIIPVSRNEFLVKLVVKKSFSLKWLDDLSFKLNHVIDNVKLEKKYSRDVYTLQFTIYLDEEEE